MFENLQKRLPLAVQGWTWLVPVVLILALVLVGVWFITEPGRQRQAAQEARAGSIMAGASQKAAQDAVGVVVERGKAEDEIDRQTEENRDAILAAPGATAPVSDDVHNAGLRAICVRDNQRCKPTCVRLLGACPERLDREGNRGR